MAAIKKKKKTFTAVVPNLFLAVAHFYFENFPRTYSQSIAQLQFSSSLSSSVAKILQKRGGFFCKLETSVNELDPNFRQSWIRLRQFFCQNQVISIKKSLHQNWNGFSGRKQVIFKKRSSPKCKRFFRPQTGGLQKKKSLCSKERHFQYVNFDAFTCQ